MCINVSNGCFPKLASEGVPPFRFTGAGIIPSKAKILLIADATPIVTSTNMMTRIRRVTLCTALSRFIKIKSKEFFKEIFFWYAQNSGSKPTNKRDIRSLLLFFQAVFFTLNTNPIPYTFSMLTVLEGASNLRSLEINTSKLRPRK